MHPTRRPAAARPGFTLLELLIGIGILGVLASVAIAAISPRRAILAARDVERSLAANGLKNALIQYQIDHNGTLPGDGSAAELGEAATPACATGVTTNAACVSLHALVPTYLPELPQDPAEPCPEYSGYLVTRTGGFIEVTAAQKGKVPGDGDVVVTPGCTSVGLPSIAGLNPWYKADALSLADNDPVATWPDSSGNATDASQPMGGNRPVYVTGVVNGLPVVRYDGSDDYLTFSTVDFGVGDFTVFFVVKQTGDDILAGRTGGAYPQCRIGEAANKLSFNDSITGPTSDTLSPAQGNWSAVAYRRSGTTVSFHQDGAARGTGTSNQLVAFNELGGALNGSATINGDLAEALFYDTALAPADLAAVFDYLAAKYGL